MKLQFCGPSDLFGRMIAQYGWGYHGFCHVAAVLASGDLLDAQWSPAGGKPAGVQIRPPGYGKWRYIEIVELPSSTEADQAWQAYLESCIGTPYDREDIVDFGLGWKPAGKGLICSWLQAKGLAKANKICDLRELFAQFSPDTLYAVVKSIGGMTITP